MCSICVPMGVMAPGQSVTLAMKVAIPASALPGAYTLGWDLDTGDTNYGAAMAQLTVTAR
jgi:hypothetical protein